MIPSPTPGPFEAGGKETLWRLVYRGGV